MLNHQRYKNTIEARRTKQRIARLAAMAAKPARIAHESVNCADWYNQKKRFSQRLRAHSHGKLTLAEGFPFLGSGARNWVQDVRCEHVFLLAGGLELIELGLEACPFCNIPEDLSRCGTVEAVQQHVESLSFSNINFITENELRGADDFYEFACLIHRVRLTGTYRKFLQDPENFCHLCALDNDEKNFLFS